MIEEKYGNISCTHSASVYGNAALSETNVSTFSVKFCYPLSLLPKKYNFKPWHRFIALNVFWKLRECSLEKWCKSYRYGRWPQPPQCKTLFRLHVDFFCGALRLLQHIILSTKSFLLGGTWEQLPSLNLIWF